MSRKLLVLAVLSVSGVLAADPIATVYRGGFLKVNGKAVPPTGAPTWSLYQHDEVVTGVDPATIAFPDGARVILGSNTRITLSRCDRCVVNLFEGTLSYRTPAVSTLEICALGHPIKPAPNTEATVVIEQPVRVVVKVAGKDQVEVAKGQCACKDRVIPKLPIVVLVGAGAAGIVGAAAVAGDAPSSASPSAPR